MRFSSDHLINVDSCKRARLNREVKNEEQRVKKRGEALQLRNDPCLRERWLNARDRLHQLRLELFKLETKLDYI